MPATSAKYAAEADVAAVDGSSISRRRFFRLALSAAGAIAGLAAGETVLAQLMGSSPFSFSSYRPPRINPAGCAPRVPSAHLPDRFLWGTSTAAYQVEPRLHYTDWAQWLKTHGSGDNPDLGPDFVHLNFDGTIGGYFREYLDAARAMGQTSFRLSLDWSRLQPEKDGPYDLNALKMYHTVLDACLERGLLPVVTLFHYVLPLWAHNPAKPRSSLGGWAGPKTVPPERVPIIDYFVRFSSDMVAEYGAKIGLLIPFNEPSGAALAEYVAGNFPGPGKLNFEAARRAQIAMAHAHAAIFDSVKEQNRLVPIGVAQGVRIFEPMFGTPGNRDAAAKLSYVTNWQFIDAVTAGTADWNLDGAADVSQAPNLAGRLDFIGINYFTRTNVLSVLPPLPLAQRHRGLPDEAIPGLKPEDPTEMGWRVEPEGLYEALLQAWSRYRLPLFVTENGIAERPPDTRRPKYIRDHVAQIERAKWMGADVRGYFYWSLMDNFEWDRGFKPPFGLLTILPDHPGQFRWTRGAFAYERIIRNHGAHGSLSDPLPKHAQAPDNC